MVEKQFRENCTIISGAGTVYKRGPTVIFQTTGSGVFTYKRGPTVIFQTTGSGVFT